MDPKSREYSRAVGNLRPCRVCQQEVSKEAKTCPHCGAPWPIYGMSPFAYKLLEGLGNAIESAQEAMEISARIARRLLTLIPKLVLLFGFFVVIGSGFIEMVRDFSSWEPPNTLFLDSILGFFLVVFAMRVYLVAKRIYQKFVS